MRINKEKDLMLLFCVGVIAISCSRPMAVQGIPESKYNVFLQESRGGLMYVYLKRDTAYFEMRQIDKPSYFTGFDTLIRVNDSGLYEGKKTSLRVSKSEISLQFSEGRKAGKEYYFSVASDKQIQKYDGYKNQDRYGALYFTVDKMIWTSTPRTAQQEKLKEDWERIHTYAPVFTRLRFDSRLKAFKARYSISD